MAEHESVKKDKKGDEDKRHLIKRQDSQTFFDQSLALDTEPFSLAETPFSPRMEEHTAMLSRIPFTAQRHAFIMRLHQTYGNRYVQRLMESMKVQAKLTVSSPDDVYEQEADRVAEAVTRSINTPVQRAVPEEEEEELQAMPILQRLEEEEEEELQMQPIEAERQEIPGKIEKQMNDARGSGQPLAENVRQPMEQAFGSDFSGVRVHTGSEADKLNQQLSARAFTSGRDIFFREGEYSPGSDSGQKLIAHELTHVVQQTGTKKPQRQPVEEEELQMKLDTQQVGFEGSQLNPETEITHRRESGKTLDGAVQRMAVMASNDMNTEKDTLVWDNLRYAVKQAGGPIGDLTTNKVWDQLSDGEEIRIVGHGSEDKKIQGFTAEDIADSMKNGPNELPDDAVIGTVTFQSCHAGEKGVQGTLVGDMKKELEAMGRYGVPVQGRTGIAFGFKGMGEATAETSKGAYKWYDPNAEAQYNSFKARNPNLPDSDGFKAYCDAMYFCKDFTTKTTNVDIFPGPVKGFCQYNKPWTILGITEADFFRLAPEERAKRVSKEMEDYWGVVGDFMQAKGGFKPAADEMLTEITENPFIRFFKTIGGWIRKLLPF